MARTLRNTASYVQFPNDASRKGHQRTINKKFRKDSRLAILKGSDVLPVVRREVDWLTH